MPKNRENKWEGFVDWLSDEVVGVEVPGLAAGALVGDQMNFACLGVTNLEKPGPITESTVFPIGSITKTFTSTVIMRLVEEGKVTLDTLVRSIEPEFKVADPEVSKAVKIRHLLTHSAGWTGDFFIDTGQEDDALQRFLKRMIELDQITPLGEVFSYSNTSFSLLGHLIEVITGKNYADVVSEYILQQLGMTQSTFDRAEIPSLAYSSGHLQIPGGMKIVYEHPFPRFGRAGGGLMCSLTDMFKYARFHLYGETKEGAKCIQDNYRKMMQSPSGVSTPLGDPIGMPWRILNINGKRVFMHGGAVPGFLANFFFQPADNIAGILLINRGSVWSLMTELQQRMMAQLLDAEIPKKETVDAPNHWFQEVEGRYQNPWVGHIDIAHKEGVLTATETYEGGYPEKQPPPPPYQVAFSGENVLLVLGGPNEGSEINIIRGENGEIVSLWNRGRVNPRISG